MYTTRRRLFSAGKFSAFLHAASFLAGWEENREYGFGSQDFVFRFNVEGAL
jgi:hypothetical protein